MAKCLCRVRASGEGNRQMQGQADVKILITLLEAQCSRAEVTDSSLSGPENMEVSTWALSTCPRIHYSRCWCHSTAQGPGATASST